MQKADAPEDEYYSYRDWGIRVRCGFDVVAGKFAAWSFVKAKGNDEVGALDEPKFAELSIEAKGMALQTAKRYVDELILRLG